MIETKLFRKRGQALIAGFLVLQILFGYSSFAQVNVVQAQLIPDAIKSDENASSVINVPKYEGVDQSIKDYLCVPEDSNLGTALYDCIGKIYRFGIAFGAIALVFFIVFAGYLYMAGGESGKEKGKTIFTTALTGMAIILSSFVLLSFINPDLVRIKPIQPPIFSASSLPKCVDVGFGENCVLPNGQVTGPSIGGGPGYGGKKCTPITNDASPASINNLSKTCFGKYGDTVVRQASIVASSESNGKPDIPVGTNSCPGNKTSRCTGGEAPAWGLFQINISVHEVAGLKCPKAFADSRGWACSRGCTVINKPLYNQCAAAAIIASNNIAAACKIYEDAGKNFGPWGNSGNEHGKKCGF